jgi:hypothetical protein
VTARSIQIGLGIIWLADGLLQLQPKMFGTSFANDVIMPSAMGQPGVLSGTITHVAHLISVQPALVDVDFAAVQLLIGVGLLMKETVKPALIVSFAWALGVWSLGEGFGGLFSGSASPLTGAPGAALLYVAIGLLVWPRREVTGAAGTEMGTRAVQGPAASEGLLGEQGGKTIWAILWCGLGILWFLPASSAGGALSGMLSGAASGEPGWLSHVQLSVAHALGGGGGAVAVGAGLLSIAIGLGPLFVRRYGIFLVAGVALALDCWVLGQAFGQIFTGIGTDPNTGPLIVLLALAVSPSGARALTGVTVVRAPERPVVVPPAAARERAGVLVS